MCVVLLHSFLRELDWKWNSWDLNCSPYKMPSSVTVAWPAVSQRQLQLVWNAETDCLFASLLPKCPQQPKSAMPKQAARSSILVFHLGYRDPTTWAIIWWLSMYASVGSWNGQRNWDPNPGILIWDANFKKHHGPFVHPFQFINCLA